MGLFGRDDRSPESTPPTQPQPARPQVSSPAPASSRTTLSRNSRIEGLLKSSGDIGLEGELSGSVETDGHLMVAESGKVDANLHGRNITVAGSVSGDITADERIELEPSAKVQGNITAPRILIKDGATFEGQVFMKSPPKPGSKKDAPATVKTSSAKRDEEKEDGKKEQAATP